MSSQFIRIILPLTSHSSKIRVKKRKDIFYQGIPLATRQEKITSDCYFEWQISYDLKETNSKFAELHKLTLNKIKIVDENKQSTDRYIYELSDLLIEIVRKGFIDSNHLKKLLQEVQNEKKFIEDELEVYRTHPKEYKFSEYTFWKSTIEHPLLIYEVSGLILKIEIIIKEKQKDYLFSHLIWREKEELDDLLEKKPRQFRKKWQEIKLKTEILSQWNNPAKLVAGYKENGRPKPTWEGVGWNSPNYREPKNRSLAALAFTYDIVLGKVEAPLLDLDPNKKDKEGNYKIKQEWLRKALVVGGKKWKAFINKHQIPYYWNTGTPGNCLIPVPYHLIGSMKGGKIFHQDTGEKIGDLLSQGDLVALPVGSDKNRQLVITKWGRKLVKRHGTEGVLRKGFLAGDIEERIEEVLNGVFLSLDKHSIQKPKKLITKKHFTEKLEKNTQRLGQIEVKVLGKLKTCLKDIWKTFYLDQKTKTTGYFLVNDYHRETAFNNLNIGNTLNICLIQGYKHPFLSRLC